jgi:DNA polymerase-3 subunit delta'
MMWRGIVGHDAVVERFRQTLSSGRLASTYLFVGPSGIGKRRFALELAHALICTDSPELALEPCSRCESCRLFAAGNHPDLEVVSLALLPILVPKKADSTKLPIDVFIGDKEHRNQEGLCHRIAFKPFLANRKIAIIDDVDHFSQESANCLLKTLEEPPPHSLMILIGTSPARQLPTIRSRSQIVRFAPLDRASIAQILMETDLVTDCEQAIYAAELSEGSVERAMQMADPALGQFRNQLQAVLSSDAVDSVRLGRSVQAFVDEAGKEPARRRDRLRTVIGFAVEYHRGVLRDLDAAEAELIIQALDASLTALEHIDRNVNQATLIAWWSGEMARSSFALR